MVPTGLLWLFDLQALKLNTLEFTEGKIIESVPTHIGSLAQFDSEVK